MTLISDRREYDVFMNLNANNKNTSLKNKVA
jgi:hypothetical protein